MDNQWGAIQSPKTKGKQNHRQSRAGGRRRRTPEEEELRDKYPNLMMWIKGRPVGCWLGTIPQFCVDLLDPSKDCKDLYPYRYAANEGGQRVELCLLIDIDDSLLKYVIDIMEKREKSRETIGGWNI